MSIHSIIVFYLMNNRENRNELRKKIQNYSYGLNDHLETGHKGNIYKGVNEQSQDRVAIKVIDLRNKQSDHLKQQLGTQIQILKMSKHPNIVRCFDVYSTVNNCYIITQFCDQGDLQNRIHSRGGVKESEALIYFKDILNGFLYLSQERFVHGNLKLSSLLIKDKIVKISGLSNARKVSKDEKDAKKQVPFNPYQSPQSVKENIFNFKSDIWSLGMILYVMLHGSFPWDYTNRAQFLQKVGRPFTIKNELSEDVKLFLKNTLVYKQLRMGLEQLVNCPLVKKIALNSSPLKYPQVNNSPIIFDKIHKKNSNHFNLNKVEKQLNTQINWMRFLLRLIDRISGYPEQNNTIAVKFIIIRQMAIQYNQLKCTLQRGENPFRFDYWAQFSANRQKISRLKDIVNKYQPRYDKAMVDYRKHAQKLKQIKIGCLNSLLNENFFISEYNSVVSLRLCLEQIKKLWARIMKQYPVKQAYEKNTPFRYKAQLLLLDFLITYYQLNGFLVEDFCRKQHFEKNSKLEQILEYQPAELDATNLGDFQVKLKLLDII